MCVYIYICISRKKQVSLAKEPHKRDLHFAKETYIFRDSTNRSHPMSVVDDNDHYYYYYPHITTNTTTTGQRRSLNTAAAQQSCVCDTETGHEQVGVEELCNLCLRCTHKRPIFCKKYLYFYSAQVTN